MRAVTLVFALCAAACLVGHIALLHSVVRQGSSRADSAVPRPRFLVELTWAAIPMLALALILTATWGRIRERSPAAPVEIMKVAR